MLRHQPDAQAILLLARGWLLRDSSALLVGVVARAACAPRQREAPLAHRHGEQRHRRVAGRGVGGVPERQQRRGLRLRLSGVVKQNAAVLRGAEQPGRRRAEQLEADPLVGGRGARKGAQDGARLAHVPAADLAVPPGGRVQQRAVVREAELGDSASVGSEGHDQVRGIPLVVEARAARVGAAGVEAVVIGREGKARDEPAQAVARALRLARRAHVALAARPAHVEDAHAAVEAAKELGAGGVEGGRMGRRDLVQVVEGDVRRPAVPGVRIPQVHRLLSRCAREHARHRVGRGHAREPGVVVDGFALAHGEHGLQLGPRRT